MLALLWYCSHPGSSRGVQNWRRVYRGTWEHNGVMRAVVVKVVSQRQAACEARVLRVVGAHAQARAIQVLAQPRLDNGDVGLVTPYCPGKLFEGAESLHDVLHQAVQLCEVRSCCCVDASSLCHLYASARWLTSWNAVSPGHCVLLLLL